MATSRAEYVASDQSSWQQHAGLPPFLPDGEATVSIVAGSGVGPYFPPVRTICKTETGTVDVTTLNTDIKACPIGQRVKIACGTTVTNTVPSFLILADLSPERTLQGCNEIPFTPTRIPMPGNTSVTFFRNATTQNSSCNWTGTFTQGATVLQGGGPAGNCFPNTNDLVILQGQLTPNNMDPGGLYPCMQPSLCNEQGGPTQQLEIKRVVSVGGGNVTIDPPIYNSNYPTLNNSWEVDTNLGIGVGLEDVLIDCRSNTSQNCIQFKDTYASWIKGVMVVGGNNAALNIERASHVLLALSYTSGRGNTLNITPNEVQIRACGDCLIIGNSFTYMQGFYQQTATSGTVYAYNYYRDGYPNVDTSITFLQNQNIQHTMGDSFTLHEGEIIGDYEDDADHGSHNPSIFHRNAVTCSDPPYTKSSSLQGIAIEGYARFYSVINNVIGYPGQCTSYKSTPQAGAGQAAIVLGRHQGFDRTSVASGGTFPVDPITPLSTMLWLNWDIADSSNPTGSNDQTGTRTCGNSSNSDWIGHCNSQSEVPANLVTYTGFALPLSGTGNGPYTGTIANLPCVYGNELVISNGQQNGFDNTYNGILIGGPTTFGNGLVSSGTVDCVTTGSVSVNFTGPPTSPQLWYLQQTATPSPFQNPVPATTADPPSYFLPVTAHPSGGTKLPFWKVCKNFVPATGCGGQFATPPFPNIGSDVVNGCMYIISGIGNSNCFNTWGGHAYDNPASLAWHYRTIDTSFQSACAISASSYDSGAKIVTITIASTCASTNGHPVIGPFQISGTGCSSGAAEFLATGSTIGSGGIQKISYSSATDPGSCVGGNFLFPDIPIFTEQIFQADTSSLAPPTNLHVIPNVQP